MKILILCYSILLAFTGNAGDIIFSGRIENGHALLFLKTVPDDKMSTYEVQFSNNGSTFSPIGFMQSDDNSPGLYTFSDLNNPQTANYYRLKIVDAYGNISYSTIIELSTFYGNKIQITWVSNPVRNVLRMKISHPEPLEISIYNTAGQLVKRSRKTPSTLIEINCLHMAKGAYFLKAVNQKGNTGSAKFLKL